MDGPNAPAPAIGTPAPFARESAPTRAQRGASAPSRWFGPANPPITDWRGKAAWIVGASTGIGRATAALLHARGAQVFVSARNVDSLN